MPPAARPRRPHRRQRPAWPVPTVTEFTRVAGVALIYGVAQWVFNLLPLTLPVAERYYLSLRPQILVPLLAGLVGGPVAGLLVGVLGRLLGDVLSGVGATGAALIYSGLLGLVAGLGARPADNARTLRTQGRAALWVLLANLVAALTSALLVQTLLLGQFTAAAGWDRALSEMLSGVVSSLLLLPAGLFVFGRRPPARDAPLQ